MVLERGAGQAVFELAVLAGGALVLPLLGWLGIARSRRFAIGNSVVLLMCSLALTSVALGYVQGSAAPTPLEAIVLYGPVALTVCGAAWLFERSWLARYQRRGDMAVNSSGIASSPVLPRAVGFSAFVLLTSLTLCCSVTSFLIPEAVDLRREPEDNLVLPLPRDLTLVSEERSCGSELCSYTFVVTTPDGAPLDQVTERLWRHLTHTKGWHRAKRMDAACQQPGWFFKDEVCIFVRQNAERPDQAVTIVLTSALTI